MLLASLGVEQIRHLSEIFVTFLQNALWKSQVCDILNIGFLYIHFKTNNQLSGGQCMSVRYDKLWSLMKSNKMKKSELASAAKLSQYTMTKLNQDRVVSMDVMIRLCKIFHCDIGDVMEIIED